MQTTQQAAELNNILSNELEKVEKWIKNNKLALNVAKAKSIIIGSCHSLKSGHSLKLCINNTTTEEVAEVKLLSAFIDSELSWSTQVEAVVKKMGKALAVERRFNKYLASDIMKLTTV